VGASQALYVAGQFRILSQSRDRVQDALACGRVDPAEILASAVVNDDASVGLAH